MASRSGSKSKKLGSAGSSKTANSPPSSSKHFLETSIDGQSFPVSSFARSMPQHFYSPPTDGGRSKENVTVTVFSAQGKFVRERNFYSDTPPPTDGEDTRRMQPSHRPISSSQGEEVAFLFRHASAYGGRRSKENVTVIVRFLVLSGRGKFARERKKLGTPTGKLLYRTNIIR